MGGTQTASCKAGLNNKPRGLPKMKETLHTALGADWPQFLGHSKMNSGWVLCQLPLFPDQVQRQKRTVSQRWKPCARKSLYITGGQRSDLRTPQVHYDSKGSKAEQSWVRPRSECPRVNRNEDFVLVLEIFWVYGTTYQILSHQKKKWELVFLPQ